MYKCVCANTVTSPFFIFLFLFCFVDLALIAEDLDVLIKIRMLGRVFCYTVLVSCCNLFKLTQNITIMIVVQGSLEMVRL